MRRLLVMLAAGTALTLFAGMPVRAQDTVRLTGSGASFPFPIYSAWFKAFSGKPKTITVDYQGKGSGAGVQDFTNRTVDFAASDAAMTDEQIAKVPGGVQMLPMTVGEFVLSYNLPGNPKALKMPRDVYPAIFLGKITKWNDAKLKAANPGVNLPDLDITVVRRADSSGTTFVFTSHLAAISEEWAKGPGSGTTVNWPKSDKLVASPKNDGVTSTIKQTPGAIGYIEYAFAKFAKLEMALLQKRAGQYVGPGGEGGPATRPLVPRRDRAEPSVRAGAVAADGSGLAVRRDRLDEHVIANMLDGYARVETLVAEGHRRLRDGPSAPSARAECPGAAAIRPGVLTTRVI